MGVCFRPFPVQRSGLNLWGDIQTWQSLRRQFKELRPDVVLSYTVKPIVWSGFALRGMPGTRFYALVTGTGFAFQGEGLMRRLLTSLVTWLYRGSLSRASRVIFQNPDNRDMFVSRKIIEKDKCALVNGSGVDLERFAFVPMPSKGVTFLAVGRMLGDKGFREYARAAQLVKARYPEAVFRLLGPGDPSPDGIPLSEVRGWGSQGWLEYLGETNDVRPFIADCHVFVLPSYHEGMPRSVLEAMAMGRPILTTDVPGCRETVLSGENGYLVPKADVETLAQKMIWCIENRSALAEMGARSRALAVERFNVHAVNHELMNIMGLSPGKSRKVSELPG
jgi:glycosyltransferase involved in cell wall biosynthesis